MEEMVNSHRIADLVNSYQNKKVLITGVGGFKGAWFGVILKRFLGAEVLGFTLLSDQGYLSRLFQSDPGLAFEIINGDVTDRDDISRAITAFQPDYIFHFAARALVLDCYENPYESFYTNVIGTINVLDAVRVNKMNSRVIVTTTDKVYRADKGYTSPFKEESELYGSDPYSGSKVCADILTDVYRKSYTTELTGGVVTLRAGNVIGGGDFASNRLFPDCVRALKADDNVVLRHPYATRPWQHVFDALFSYAEISAIDRNDNSAATDIWNVGPKDASEITVESAVQIFHRAFGRASKLTIVPSERHETTSLMLDSRKVLEKRGVYSRLSINQAIEWTADWYKVYLNGPSSGELIGHSIKQIDDYICL